MVKVVFKRNYKFRGLNDRLCEVELILPANDEGYLIPELRDSKSVVFGWELNNTWGHYDRSSNTRYYELRLGGSTWGEVEKEADELITDALEQLTKVYKKNLEELRKTPRDREEIYYLGDEFTSRYIGDIFSWQEYISNLDLSNWSWVNSTPWNDREAVELGGNLFAIPVYPRDIYDDSRVSSVELPNSLLAISWDNFHDDVAVIKNEDIDKLAGWLLVEKVSDREYRVVNGAVRSLDAIQELAMQYQTEA